NGTRVDTRFFERAGGEAFEHFTGAVVIEVSVAVGEAGDGRRRTSRSLGQLGEQYARNCSHGRRGCNSCTARELHHIGGAPVSFPTPMTTSDQPQLAKLKRDAMFGVGEPMLTPTFGGCDGDFRTRPRRIVHGEVEDVARSRDAGAGSRLWAAPRRRKHPGGA